MTSKIKVMILFCFFFGFCLPMDAVALKGDAEVRGRTCQSIPAQRFKHCTIRYLCRNLGKNESDIVLSRFKVAGNRPVSMGNIEIRLSRKSEGRLTGNVRLDAVVRVNGVDENNVQLYSWVDVFDKVVCAAHDLKRNHVIQKDDLYLARKNVSHMPSNTLRALDDAVGLIMRHNVKADTGIKEWMVEKRPVVKRGDIVTIMAESDDLRVTVPGRIMARGYPGELVKVENAVSKKKIYARVVSNLLVMVNF